MSHTIQLDSQGNRVPSVTRVTGIYAKDLSGFQNWICQGMGAHPCCTAEAKAYMQETADLGNRIHELREEFLSNKFSFPKAVLTEQEGQLFEPIAQFYREAAYSPELIECHKYSDTLRLNGTIDGAGKFKRRFWEKGKKNPRLWANYPGFDPTPDDLWIEDLKIKSKLDVTHPLQLFGYAELLRSEGYGEANWGLIIRRNRSLEKMPPIQLKIYYLPPYRKYWEASRLMYDFLNGVQTNEGE